MSIEVNRSSAFCFWFLTYFRSPETEQYNLWFSSFLDEDSKFCFNGKNFLILSVKDKLRLLASSLWEKLIRLCQLYKGLLCFFEQVE